MDHHGKSCMARLIFCSGFCQVCLSLILLSYTLTILVFLFCLLALISPSVISNIIPSRWLTKFVQFSTMVLLSKSFLTAIRTRLSLRSCDPAGQYKLNFACARFFFPKNSFWMHTTPALRLSLASSAEIVYSYPFP